jgi:hypothetical protein
VDLNRTHHVVASGLRLICAEECEMADKEKDPIQNGILGDINPTSTDHVRRRGEPRDSESDESMEGGSQHDRSQHPGSRDVTEGVTGGTGTEVGGTRNYRQGTGATGTDIGNRPE